MTKARWGRLTCHSESLVPYSDRSPRVCSEASTQYRMVQGVIRKLPVDTTNNHPNQVLWFKGRRPLTAAGRSMAPQRS